MAQKGDVAKMFAQKCKWMWLSEWWIDECKVIIRLMNVIGWMNNVYNVRWCSMIYTWIRLLHIKV